jgi:hypothetical protein
MKTTVHPVASEELMAYLDGQLSPSESERVAAHLEVCPECAAVGEEVRGTSAWLSRWEVPAVPPQVEDRVRAAIEESGSSRKIAKRGSPFRRRRPVWRLWAMGGAGACAVIVVLVGVIFATSSHPVRLASHTMASMAEPLRAKTGGVAEALQALDPGQPAPMIARTVTITVMVEDFAKSRAALDAILARHHGYSSRVSVLTPRNSPPSLDGSLRIPAPELAAALDELRRLGRVDNETQSGEEVTQQHADLAARLQTARATEDRFRAILQQRTGSVADVLEVEEGIARVRGEIESMEAEQKTLEHRVDFATVDIQLSEEFKARLVSPGDSVSARMSHAMVAGYRNAVDTVLGIVLFLEEYGPAIAIWLALLGIPAVFIRRRYRRAKARI